MRSPQPASRRFAEHKRLARSQSYLCSRQTSHIRRQGAPRRLSHASERNQWQTTRNFAGRKTGCMIPQYQYGIFLPPICCVGGCFASIRCRLPGWPSQALGRVDVSKLSYPKPAVTHWSATGGNLCCGTTFYFSPVTMSQWWPLALVACAANLLGTTDASCRRPLRIDRYRLGKGAVR